MMQERSTGGELQRFEGLIHRTAQIFAAQVKREEEDLAQELRIVAWRTVASFDPGHARRLSLERYVFTAITNKIKDFKRDAARRAKYGVAFISTDECESHAALAESWHCVDHDEVYQRIDEGYLTLPATVTLGEASVLLLMLMDYGRAEIAVRLAMRVSAVETAVRSLRVKLDDWRPAQQPDSSQTVSVSDVPLAA